MRPIGTHNYFNYILTNKSRKVLYVGATNDLKTRLYEHRLNAETVKTSFTGRYNVYYLVYYEHHQWVHHALDREKEIKGWKREKKIRLIEEFNPSWGFLNDEIDDWD